MDRVEAVILVALVLITAAIAVMTIGATIDIDAMQDFNDRAEAWCDAEGGSLYVANAIGASGGTHCSGIGGHVHMHDVAALGWTHDLDAIQQHYEQRTGPLNTFSRESMAVALPMTLAIGAFAFAIAVMQRWRRSQPRS